MHSTVGEAGMPEYRAYIVGLDGHFLRSVELVCPDEKTAKEYAKNLLTATTWSFGKPTARLRRLGITLLKTSNRRERSLHVFFGHIKRTSACPGSTSTSETA